MHESSSAMVLFVLSQRENWVFCVLLHQWIQCVMAWPDSLVLVVWVPSPTRWAVL